MDDWNEAGRAFLPICQALAEATDNPPAPLLSSAYWRIYAEGSRAVAEHPPRFDGKFGFRSFGINPYRLFSSEYNAWNDGYEEEASRLAVLNVQGDAFPL